MAGIGNLFDMMKNAKQMMDKAKEAQGELAKKTVDGQSGAGLVAATVNGLGELVGLRIDPAAMTPPDPDMLADLVIAAVADARNKIDAVRADAMREMTGGLDLSSLGVDLNGLL